MRGLELLIRTAILTVLVGGGGTIVALVGRWRSLQVPMMYVLIAGLVVTLAILVWAVVIGLYHLYLYFFTDRRPLGFFATAPKDEPGAPASPPGTPGAGA